MCMRWFRYVEWHDVPSYEAYGWTHPRNQVSCPRLHAYGTTLEWIGDGEPPIPLKRRPSDRGPIANKVIGSPNSPCDPWDGCSFDSVLFWDEIM